MAQAINRPDFIDPDVFANHLAVIAERGLDANAYADSVEPESELLAAAIRRHAAENAPAPKRATSGGKRTATTD